MFLRLLLGDLLGLATRTVACRTWAGAVDKAAEHRAAERVRRAVAGRCLTVA
jgi:hypothetical protein